MVKKYTGNTANSAYPIDFDVEIFRACYPEFESLSDELLQTFWDAACMISGLNTKASPVGSESELRTLLNMLTCHLATLYQRGDGIVGNIASATEGSVSTGIQSIPSTNANWWYNQTRCGAAYWVATTRYRLGGRWFAFRRY